MEEKPEENKISPEEVPVGVSESKEGVEVEWGVDLA